MKNFGKNNVWTAIFVIMIAVGCFLLVASQIALYVTHAPLFGASVLDEFVAWGPILGPTFIVLGGYGLFEDHKEAKKEEAKRNARHARIAKAKEGMIQFPSR